MIDTKALRQKVLDLAIRGKLVPQDPNDEPASVLLERIRAQKQQMVKECKLKAKDIKNDTVIFVGEDNLHYEKFADGTVKCIEDEIPFDLPEGWEWARTSSICIINPKNDLNDDTEASFVPMPHICEGYVNHHSFDVRKWSEIKTGYTHFAENDIGIAKITPCFENRKSVVFHNLKNGIGAGTTELFILRPIISVEPDYLLWITKTDEFINGGVETFSAAVGQQRVDRNFVAKYLIPLPPTNEQKRIIEKINIAFSFINAIDEDKADLTASISSAKSKILDLAIRGKLVPQDPNDEPASVLLERIRAEKEELIKQGKIKRDKKESVIFKGEDNSYYDRVPKNWEEISLQTIAEIELGKTLDATKNTGEPQIYLRSVNIKWNEIDLSDLKQMKFEQNEVERYTVKRDDLLICEGGDVGRCCIWKSDTPIFYQNALHRVRFYGNCSPKFFLYYMMFLESIGYLKRVSNGVTIKHLTKNVLTSIPFLLPPLAEQEKIVKAIEILFEQLDNISNTLE